MPNIYELPGGALEAHETLIDALKREIIEEISCTIDNIIRYLGHIDFLSSSGLSTRRFNFLVTPKLPFSVTLSEHADFFWIVPTEAHHYEITLQTQKIITSIL